MLRVLRVTLVLPNFNLSLLIRLDLMLPNGRLHPNTTLR